MVPIAGDERADELTFVLSSFLRFARLFPLFASLRSLKKGVMGQKSVHRTQARARVLAKEAAVKASA